MAENFGELEPDEFKECMKQQRIDRFEEMKANDKRFIQDLVLHYISMKIPKAKAIKNAIICLKQVEDAIEKYG
jgi:hypothetical protein